MKVLIEKASAFCRLMRWHRPVGFWLLLWPTLWGLCFASSGHMPWYLILIFTLGVFLMRSAGCVINDYWDQDIDPQVSRTRLRPLAAKELSPKSALCLFFVLLALSASLLFFLPLSSLWYACGALVLTVCYPLMKRIMSAPQFVLGIAFSWGLPMAVASISKPLSAPIWVLWVLSWVWIVAYDTQYALADREDDLKAGVRSTAVALGDHAELVVMLLHALVLLVWLCLAWWESWSAWCLFGWCLAVLVLIQQWQWMKTKQASAYTRAFCSNQWLGFFLLVSAYIGYMA